MPLMMFARARARIVAGAHAVFREGDHNWGNHGQSANSSRSSVLISKEPLVLAPARAVAPAPLLFVFARKMGVRVAPGIPQVPRKSHAWRGGVRWDWRDLRVQPPLTRGGLGVLYLFLFDSHIHARATRIISDSAASGNSDVGKTGRIYIYIYIFVPPKSVLLAKRPLWGTPPAP